MSQPSSSIISADNAEIKYKKALKEISKLISANRALRESNDKATRELKEKIDQLSLRYEDLEKQYESVRKQKENFTHYLDQIHKQKKNLDREVVYLNEVLAQQNAELKKLNAHKDERAVAALIRTYQQKQTSMNRTRIQNEDMISKLKSTVDRLENDLQFEKNSREEADAHLQRFSSEMRSYQEQNKSLLEQVERLLRDSSQKDAFCAQKQKQLRSLANEFQKQIGLLKSAQEQTLKSSSKPSETEAYEQILNEKNKLAIQLAKIQNSYEEMILREKEYFEMEEKMKTARLQAERANEQVNMLKSKIVLLEAKDFLEEAGDDDYNQKFFEERLNLLVAQNDPLNTIKNHEDSSHFRILKSFIVDLQDKIYKINNEKKEINRKYKSMKSKFVKNAQQLGHYEEQNKLMKGKLEGYERLTEKLQFQLERSLTGNQEQITRMTITSNNLITKKVQEYKAAINLLNSQLEMNQDKASRTEKNYKQEVETLRLELDTLKIRFKDETDKTNKDNELIDLYKKKNADLTNRVNTLEEQVSVTTQNLSKFEQLFKEQKGKNEGLVSQKQQLLAQTRQLSQEVDKKSSTFNSTFKIKEDQYEFELRKLKTQNQKIKDELEYNIKEIKSLKKDLQQNRRGEQSQFGEIKRLTQRNSQLEGKIIELKRTIRNLEDEIETSKIKNKKFQESYQKTAKYQQQNTNKNDRINDLTREKILLESEIKNLQNNLNDEVKQNQQYKKELSNLKMKSLEGNHESKREFESKLLELKKNTQSLNQQISDLTTELRDEKSKILRLTSQLNTVKAEKNRLQDLVDQNRKKDLHNEGQVSNIKLELSNAELQIERLQSQIKNQQTLSNNLNIEIETLQQKIFLQNQELSSLKMKLESAEDMKNDLIKDLNSIKYNFSTVENHANQAKTNLNLSWQEQNFISGVSDILSKIKRIWRSYGISFESTNTGYISPASELNPSVGVTSKANTITSKPAGSNYFEYFSSYAAEDQNNYKPLTRADRNFDTSIGTAQSIGLNKIDYNYSTTSYGGSQGIVNNSSVQNDWNRPTYDYNPSRNNFQFNLSALSKVTEQ